MIDVEPKVLPNSLNVTSYIVGDISNVLFEPFLALQFIIFRRTQMRQNQNFSRRTWVRMAHPGAPGKSVI